MTGVRLTAL
jgi:hypothetical protein